MLTSSERRALKARAHKLEPVVRIGAKGLTEEVVAEIDRALKAHDCGRTGAERVQNVGKIFVLFRKNDE